MKKVRYETNHYYYENADNEYEDSLTHQGFLDNGYKVVWAEITKDSAFVVYKKEVPKWA